MPLRVLLNPRSIPSAQNGRTRRTLLRGYGLWAVLPMILLLSACSPSDPTVSTPETLPEPKQSVTVAPPDTSDLPYEAWLTVVTPEELAAQIKEARGLPVIVNVWAPWCKPCVAEMPELETFYKTRDEGHDQARLISVAVMSNIDLRLRPFMEDHQIPFEVLYVDTESPDAVVKALPWKTTWDGALPATFALDAEGQLTHEWFEEVTEPMLAEALGLT